MGFLQDARDHGFTTPEVSLDRSRQWLLEQVQQSANAFGTWSANLRKSVDSGRIDSSYVDTLREDHRRFAGLATAALVLARDKKAPLSTVRQLRQLSRARARRCPWCSWRWRSLMGDEGRMKAALDQAMAREYGIVRRSNSSTMTSGWATTAAACVITRWPMR